MSDSAARAPYPLVEQEADGTWTAWYPEDAALYAARTRAEVVQKLPLRVVRPLRLIEPDGHGRWRGRFPDLGIEVTAPSEEEADIALRSEFGSRVAKDPEFRRQYFALVNNPPSTWQVDFISEEEAQREDAERRERGVEVVEMGLTGPTDDDPDACGVDDPRE